MRLRCIVVGAFRGVSFSFVILLAVTCSAKMRAETQGIVIPLDLNQVLDQIFAPSLTCSQEDEPTNLRNFCVDPYQALCGGKTQAMADRYLLPYREAWRTTVQETLTAFEKQLMLAPGASISTFMDSLTMDSLPEERNIFLIAKVEEVLYSRAGVEEIFEEVRTIFASVLIDDFAGMRFPSRRSKAQKQWTGAEYAKDIAKVRLGKAPELIQLMGFDSYVDFCGMTLGAKRISNDANISGDPRIFICPAML